ncbi:hypothetical protein [Sciscionella marina]|nr:hypothetical protein [Sciscionella marina]
MNTATTIANIGLGHVMSVMLRQYPVIGGVALLAVALLGTSLFLVSREKS